MKKIPEPLFKHDCPDCVYLGRHKGVDLWYCQYDKTLVVRYRDMYSIGEKPACTCCAPEDVPLTYEDNPENSMMEAYRRWYKMYRMED